MPRRFFICSQHLPPKVKKPHQLSINKDFLYESMTTHMHWDHFIHFTCSSEYLTFHEYFSSKFQLKRHVNLVVVSVVKQVVKLICFSKLIIKHPIPILSLLFCFRLIPFRLPFGNKFQYQVPITKVLL